MISRDNLLANYYIMGLIRIDWCPLHKRGGRSIILLPIKDTVLFFFFISDRLNIENCHLLLLIFLVSLLDQLNKLATGQTSVHLLSQLSITRLVNQVHFAKINELLLVKRVEVSLTIAFRDHDGASRFSKV